ncbi:hypothetical protein PENTCL1PPCAC_25023, partial [Pristionchus entomophagus]
KNENFICLLSNNPVKLCMTRRSGKYKIHIIIVPGNTVMISAKIKVQRVRDQRSNMGAHVGVEVGGAVEGLIAVDADVRLHLSVREAVPREVSGLPEGAAAVLALERLLARVDSLVRDECITAREGLLADVTSAILHIASRGSIVIAQLGARHSARRGNGQTGERGSCGSGGCCSCRVRCRPQHGWLHAQCCGCSSRGRWSGSNTLHQLPVQRSLLHKLQPLQVLQRVGRGVPKRCRRRWRGLTRVHPPPLLLLSLLHEITEQLVEFGLG